MALTEFESQAESLIKVGQSPININPSQPEQMKPSEIDITKSSLISKATDRESYIRAKKIAPIANENSDFIARNIGYYDNIKEKELVNKSIELANKHPQLLKPLSKPDVYAIVKDDLDNVDEFGVSIKEYSKGAYTSGNFLRPLISGYQSFRAGKTASALFAGEGNKEENIKELVDRIDAQNTYNKYKPDYAKIHSEKLAKAIDLGDRGLNKIASSVEELSNLNMTEAIKKFKSGSSDLGTLLEHAGQLRDKNILKGIYYSGLESAANSIDAITYQSAVNAIGTVAAFKFAPKPLLPMALKGVQEAGNIAKFFGSVSSERGGQILEDIRNAGYDASNPDSIRKALNDKAFVDRVNARATRKGAGTAGTELLVDTFATFAVGKPLSAEEQALKSASRPLIKKGLSKAGKVSLKLLGEMGLESYGEYVGQIAREQGIKNTSVFESLNEGVTSLGQSINDIAVRSAFNLAQSKTKDKTGEEGQTTSARAGQGAQRKSKSTVSGDVERATGVKGKLNIVADAYTKSKDAIGKGLELLNANRILQQSKTFKDSKETIMEILDNFVENNDASLIYFEADDFDSIMEQKGIDPESAASDLVTEPKDYEIAKQTGGMLSVPLKKMFENFAGTDTFAELVEKGVFSEDGEKFNIAVENLNAFPEQVKNIFDADTETQATQESILKTTLKESLSATSLDEKQKGLSERLFYESFKTLSERIGISEDEFSQKYLPQITQLTPAEEQSFIRKNLKSLGKDTAINPDTIKGFFEVKDGFNIKLFKTANLNTFIHEMGHYYLELTRTIAKDNQAFNDDLKVIYDFVGAKESESLTRDQEEMFAKAFQTYLRTGEAPTSQLYSVFNSIKLWFKRMYQTAFSAGVKITPEISALFDRLIATDRDIEAFRNEVIYDPVFTLSEEQSMTDEEFSKYKELISQSKEESTKGIMEATKDTEFIFSKDYLEAKKAARNEIRNGLLSDKTMVAKYYLSKHKAPDGNDIVDQPKFKVDTEDLLKTLDINEIKAYAAFKYKDKPNGAAKIKSFTEGILNGSLKVPAPLKEKLITYQLGNIHSRVGKGTEVVSIDAASNFFNFKDPQEFVREMQNSKRNFKEETDFRTEAFMRLNFEEEFSSQSDIIQSQSFVTESFAKKSRYEFEFILNKLSEDRKSEYAVPDADALRREVEDSLYSRPISDLRKKNFSRAIIKSMKNMKAFYKENDIESAALYAKRLVYANEMEAVRSEILFKADTLVRSIKRNTKASSLKTAVRAESFDNRDYSAHIKGLLSRFKFNDETFKPTNLSTFIQDMETELEVPLDFPLFISNEGNQLDHRNLTIEELEELHDAFSIITHLYRDAFKLKVVGRNQTLEEVSRSAADVIDSPLKPKIKEKSSPSFTDNISKFGTSFILDHIRLDIKMRELDSFEKYGYMQRLVSQPISDAENLKLDKIQFYAGKIKEVYNRNGITRHKLLERRYYSGIDEQITGEKRIAIGFLSRDEEAFRKFLSGQKRYINENFTMGNVQEILDDLSEEEIAFINELGAIAESFYPELDALNMRIKGIKLNKVKSPSRKLANGIILGGYAPIRRDHNYLASHSNPTQLQTQGFNEKDYQNEIDRLNIESRGIRQMSPKSSSRKARGQDAEYVIQSDLNSIQTHIYDVIHDLTYTELLLDLRKVFNSPDVKDALASKYGDLYIQKITDDVLALAVGKAKAMSNAMRVLSYISRTYQASKMAINLFTGINQITGIVPAMNYIGEKEFAYFSLEFIESPKQISKKIYEISPFMRSRVNTFDSTYSDLRQKLSKDDLDLKEFQTLFGTMTNFSIIGDKIKENSLAHIAIAQYQVDKLTFWAEYQKQLALNVPEEDAIKMGEQAVIFTQGGGRFVDRPNVQRDGALQLANNFYTYNNTQLNALYTYYKEFRLKYPEMTQKQVLKMSMKTIKRIMYTYTLPSLIASNIYSLFSAGGNEEDEDRTFLEGAGYIALDTVLEMLSGLSILRNVSQAARGFYKGDAKDQFFAEIQYLIKNLSKDEINPDNVTLSAFKVLSMTTPYVPNQVIKSYRGTKSYINDDTDDPRAIISGPPRR